MSLTGLMNAIREERCDPRPHSTRFRDVELLTEWIVFARLDLRPFYALAERHPVLWGVVRTLCHKEGEQQLVETNNRNQA
jgi:hypothetical protein